MHPLEELLDQILINVPDAHWSNPLHVYQTLTTINLFIIDLEVCRKWGFFKIEL